MFVGWIDIDADPVAVADAVLGTNRPTADVNSWADSGAGFIVRPNAVSSLTSHGSQLHSYIEGLPSVETENGVVEIVGERVLADFAQRYREGTSSSWAQLRGSFAFVIFDFQKRKLVLATDRFAQRPIYVTKHERGCVFASNPALIARFPGRNSSINLQSVYDYFYFHVIPGPSTIYDEIERIEAATVAEFASSNMSVRRYWRPEFLPDARFSARADNEARLRQFMEQAVLRSVANGREVGAFLSGGIDSSTVVGNLSRLADGQTKAFSIGFDVDGFDETEYARTAARTFGLEHHEYRVTPADIVEVLPKLAQVYGQPFGNSSAVPTYACARLARDHGVSLMLGGDGGDELFGGNRRYAFQWLLGLYGRVPPWLAKGVLESILLNSQWIARVPVLRKLRSYVEQARVPLPERLEGFNLLRQLRVSEFFESSFLAEIDEKRPASIQKAYFDCVDAKSEINKILGFDFKFTLSDNDLPKVVGMSEAAGVEARFPFLDADVIDLSIHLPEREKVSGMRLRPFFKRAMRGFLPDQILTKSKHGFGLPYGHWLRDPGQLRELSFDSLSSLKSRGIVRPQMIDALSGAKLVEHASYYGSAVWLLVVFELWMQEFERSRKTGGASLKDA